MKTTDCPECLICGASAMHAFPLFPQTEGYRFGEICGVCDANEQEDDDG